MGHRRIHQRSEGRIQNQTGNRRRLKPNTYIHTYCTYIHTCIRTYIYKDTCIQSVILEILFGRRCSYIHTQYIHTIHTYIHTYYTYAHTYTKIYAYIILYYCLIVGFHNTYIHTYTTYIYVHTNTYIHT